jgi:hypothetical protein
MVKTMSARIQELIAQATVPVVETNDYNGMAYETYQFSQELFAQLIVQECLAECWYDATPKQIADNIKEKFGVKEL